ncbi:type II toxin-antitoxin system HicB family antitoxin [Maricaulis sp.]|uniref:type II toxin-antitoxin system HicB family antitoxin n=1 Tax=Maricaulis sp. TaxID=1486257 RepID=UPI0032970EEA
MKHFIGIVHQDGDNAYGIQFPDVPGCFSAADDLDDLPRLAREALALWFEDAPPVAPRSLAELRQAPEVREAMRDDGFFLAIPLIQLSGRTVKANLTMDAGLLQAIDATARARGMTRSAFLADAARREISG